MSIKLNIVILAAGLGKRMQSALPKVLHRLSGKTLLEHSIQTANALGAHKPIIVVGHQREKIQQALAHIDATWVEQPLQLGTGHALAQTLPFLDPTLRTLVLYGDVPLISVNTLNRFIETVPAHGLGIITAHVAHPAGLGRIIRDDHGNMVRIIEEKEATETERLLTEINSGIYLIPTEKLPLWLKALTNQNAQQEYYLTDIVPLAVNDHISLHSIQPDYPEEIMGVNNRLQLAALERFFQRQQAENLMRQGVTVVDPARLDVRGELTVGHDTIIDINVIIEGRVVIGKHCIIGAHTLLRNVVIQDHTEIKSHCVIDGADIATECVIGPFSRIRPGTVLATGVHVGNFAEIKNTVVGQASKIHHVSYIGDSELGSQVNIGAGTITCNYDGANKYRTIIGDNAFIGSNTELVAPVTIGEHATIGAGSTITRDAPPHELTLARTKQTTIKNWKRKNKNIIKENI